MASLARITREDGRSDAQVLLEYLRQGSPGQVYTYAELGEVLSLGQPEALTIPKIRAVCVRIYPRLLREHQRALQNIRCVGYRLAEAHDHARLATGRKHKADRQMQLGYLTLQQVRWEELSPNARLAHEGQLMLLSAVLSQQEALEKRMARIEQVLGRQ